jgi:hypothetical protein
MQEQAQQQQQREQAQQQQQEQEQAQQLQQQEQEQQQQRVTHLEEQLRQQQDEHKQALGKLQTGLERQQEQQQQQQQGHDLKQQELFGEKVAQVEEMERQYLSLLHGGAGTFTALFNDNLKANAAEDCTVTKRMLVGTNVPCIFREGLLQCTHAPVTLTHPNFTLTFRGPLGRGSYGEVYEGRFKQRYSLALEGVAIKLITAGRGNRQLNATKGELQREFFLMKWLDIMYGTYMASNARFVKIFIKPPFLEPYLLLDRDMDVASRSGIPQAKEREPMLVMERLSITISQLYRGEGGFDITNVHCKVFFGNAVRATYIMAYLHIQHNDMHWGNLGYVYTDKDGKWLKVRPAEVQMTAYRHTQYHMKVFDWGLAEMMGDDHWQSNGRTGSPVVTAPRGWQHNDWWSVLAIGFYLSGLEVPWGHGKLGYSATAKTIEDAKEFFLLGQIGWSKSISSLKALQQSRLKWYESVTGIGDNTKKLIASFNLEFLFSELIDGEIAFLQDNSNRKWHRVASERILAKCGGKF